LGRAPARPKPLAPGLVRTPPTQGGARPQRRLRGHAPRRPRSGRGPNLESHSFSASFLGILRELRLIISRLRWLYDNERAALQLGRDLFRNGRADHVFRFSISNIVLDSRIRYPSGLPLRTYIDDSKA